MRRTRLFVGSALESLDVALVLEGYFDGRRIPWAVVLRACGGMLDAPAIWHGITAANDERMQRVN